MKITKTLAAVAAALALVFSSVLVAAPASAAPVVSTGPSVAPAAWFFPCITSPSENCWDSYIKKVTQPKAPGQPRKIYDFTPTDPNGYNVSTGKIKQGPKAFMLNVGSKVLGAAMPTKWAAEQLANQMQYDHSWEGLDRSYHSGTASSVPDSHADYVLDKLDYKNKQTTKPKAAKPPVAPASKFAKNAGSGIMGLSAMLLTPIIADGFFSLIGVDNDGLVCGAFGDDFGGRAVQMLTGTNCDMFAVDPSFVPNLDASMSVGAGVCPPSANFPSSEYSTQPVTCSLVETLATTTQDTSNWMRLGPLGDTPLQMFTGIRPSSTPGYVQVLKATSAQREALRSTVAATLGIASNRVSFIDASLLFICTVPGTTGTVAPIGGGAGILQAADVTGDWVERQLPICPATTRVSGVDYPVELVIVGSSSQAYPAGRATAVMYRGSAASIVPIEVDAADPDRVFECSVLGTDGITYSATSAPYRESQGSFAAPECAALPEGVGPASTTITQTGGGAPPAVVYDQPSTPEYLDWRTTYPDCADGSCVLDLLVHDSTHTDVASCFDLGTMCDGWFEQEDRDTEYQCRYGSYDVEIAECFVYSGVFNEARQNGGAPYSDPEDGVWSGGFSDAGKTTAAFGTAIQNPAGSRQCTGMGATGFDPVAFVLRPIQCALEWAFVPRPAAVAVTGAGVTTAFDEVAPGQLATMVGGWEVHPVMTGCEITVAYPPMPGAAPMPITVVDACPGSVMEPIAAISRTVVTVGVVVLVVVLIRRQVAGTIDYRA